jgi:prefoldin subunit 5
MKGKLLEGSEKLKEILVSLGRDVSITGKLTDISNMNIPPSE